MDFFLERLIFNFFSLSHTCRRARKNWRMQKINYRKKIYCSPKRTTLRSLEKSTVFRPHGLGAKMEMKLLIGFLNKLRFIIIYHGLLYLTMEIYKINKQKLFISKGDARRERSFLFAFDSGK